MLTIDYPQRDHLIYDLAHRLSNNRLASYTLAQDIVSYNLNQTTNTIYKSNEKIIV
jgi:hypothetical protein